MFNLYYPDESGNLSLVGQFASQQACDAQAASDGKVSYTIQMVENGQVVMVVSC